jgi:hypothetical protein
VGHIESKDRPVGGTNETGFWNRWTAETETETERHSGRWDRWIAGTDGLVESYTGCTVGQRFTEEQMCDRSSAFCEISRES